MTLLMITIVQNVEGGKENNLNTMELLRKMSGQTAILTIPKVFLELTDNDHNASLLLSQCIYWYEKVGRRPFYKTYKEWHEEIGLTRYQLDKAREKLEGTLVTEIHRANGAPTLHYAIDYEFLEDLVKNIGESRQSGERFVRNSQMDLSESDNSLTVDYNIKKDTDKSESNNKPSKNTTWEMAEILADVCHMDLLLNKGRLLREAKMLLADERIKPALIKSVYGNGGRWYKEDWRGKKGDPPKPHNIRETFLSLMRLKTVTKTITGSIKDR